MREFLVSVGAEQWLLIAMVLWPIAAAIVVRALGADPIAASTKDASIEINDARVLTTVALVLEALMGVALWFVYDPGAVGWQARVDVPWLADIGATLSLGVDGLSMPMVVMTAVLMPLTLIGSWNNVKVRTPAFCALALVLTAGLIGVLVSLDLLLFYLSWELMLIPTYFLVGVWGTGASIRASMRYVLFTLIGSLLMLVAIVALWNSGGGTTFHLDALLRVRLDERAQLLMFAAFFLAFAIKSALVPFHSWLPDAQSSAPTFAAVTLGLKVGAYAMLRFAIPLFPAAATNPLVRSTILVISVVAIVYGALVAMAQRDVKRMVSYSSISHLGFIMLGTFALTQQSVQGAVMVMINHGVTTSALFLLAGLLQDRLGSTELGEIGGTSRNMPLFSVMLTLAILSTMGLPGTNGFVGEFLVLLGTYNEAPLMAIVATTGVVFAAIYGLRLLQSVVFAPAADASVTTSMMQDLSGAERVALGVLAVGIIWLGIAPAPLLARTEGVSRSIVEGARFGPNAQPLRAASSPPRGP